MNFKYLRPAWRMGLMACLLLTPLAYAENLSLNQAIEKTLQQNPSLQAFAVKKQALQQKQETQALNPALALGFEMENVLGTGEAQGFDSGEYTLSLSSVIELGDKADTRVASVKQESYWLDAKEKVAALDMISEVSKSYIDAINNKQQLALAKAQVELAKQTLTEIKKRHKIGLLSAAELARSEADLAKAKLLERQFFYLLKSQKAKLAGFWGETNGQNYVLDASQFYQQPSLKPKAFLLEQLQQSPMLEALSQKERLSEANIKQIRSENSSDLAWTLGVTKEQAAGDYSVTAGVSMPLFNKQRNTAKIQQYLAQQQEVSYQKSQQLLLLQQEIGQRYQQFQMAVETSNTLEKTIIPALARALKTIHQGYLKGRFSYLEWADIQKQLLDAKQQFIQSHSQAWLIRNDIERMTGLSSQQHSRNTP